MTKIVSFSLQPHVLLLVDFLTFSISTLCTHQLSPISPLTHLRSTSVITVTSVNTPWFFLIQSQIIPLLLPAWWEYLWPHFVQFWIPLFVSKIVCFPLPVSPPHVGLVLHHFRTPRECCSVQGDIWKTEKQKSLEVSISLQSYVYHFSVWKSDCFNKVSMWFWKRKSL